ncbi:MAG: ribonuclease HI family protein [Patescibacteria group bacterium]|nr:ribonuclease HI family protein [Patescibacteria group bacterium]
MSNQKYQIYTDGGARGNPGPAGLGVVIWQGHKLIGQYKKYIGKATNNQAEYQAIHFGLQKAKEVGAKNIECFLDSELVVNQLNMEFKIKNKELGPWFIKIWNLRQSFDKVTFTHIRREKNKEADKLVNEAIDEAK